MYANLVRVAAILPLLVSSAAAVLLVIQSLGAGGAASDAGLASWLPPVSGVVVAAPVLGLGYFGSRRVWTRVRGQVRVHIPGALGGGFVHCCVAALLVVLSATVSDPTSYAMDGEADVSTAGFMFFAVLSAMMELAIIGGVTAVYTFAFEPGPSRQRETAPDDRPDIVDEWVQRRPGRRIR